MLSPTVAGLIRKPSAPTVWGCEAQLKLYDGKWDVTTTLGGSGVDHLENHCTRTGLFFVCEQIFNGKSQALVIFLPVATLASGGEEYRNMGLPADASSSGGWGKVTIKGDNWTYFWETGAGEKKVQWRNADQFSGTDKIHFEIQSSEDGTTWKQARPGMKLAYFQANLRRTRRLISSISGFELLKRNNSESEAIANSLGQTLRDEMAMHAC